MRRAAYFSVACLALLFACVTSEVSRIGKAQYPPKAKGCPVEVFPSTTPDYQWTDIASVESRCHFANGRDACITELKDKTCELGGDTLYGFKDGKAGEYSIVIGTVGVRKPGDHPKSGGTAPKSSASPPDGCSPPCSPGYRCEKSECVALCNPPCGAGMRCNQQRVCESDPPKPSTDSAPATE